MYISNTTVSKAKCLFNKTKVLYELQRKFRLIHFPRFVIINVMVKRFYLWNLRSNAFFSQAIFNIKCFYLLYSVCFFIIPTNTTTRRVKQRRARTYSA